MKITLKYLLILVLLVSTVSLFGQRKSKKKKKENKTEVKSALDKLSLSGLKFRSIGPANTSGRISDFAVNPDRPHEYYVDWLRDYGSK